MKKIKIEELGCFNEVASVIGVTEAKRELFKVASGGFIDRPQKALIDAFHWRSSPQGYAFWKLIDIGVNPTINP